MITNNVPKAIVTISLLSLLIYACTTDTVTPNTVTPSGNPTETQSPPVVIPSDTPTLDPIPPYNTSTAWDDDQPALPPLMVAIDESKSMVFPGCDQSRNRYHIPKFLIDVFSDLQNPVSSSIGSGVVQPSDLSLYYLDQYAVAKPNTRLLPTYQGTFENARTDGYWGLTRRDSGGGNYVYLFDEILSEYKIQLMNASNTNEVPWLLLFTDGYFDDKKQEAISTKRELREIATYENARVFIFLICPQKYENDYPGVEDYWLQRASESNGKIIVLGKDSLEEGISGLMSALLYQVGWPVKQNDENATNTKGWGLLQNEEVSISIPAETLHLYVPDNYIYLLGTDDFETPEISFDGQEVYVPKNIYPRDENCEDHLIELKNELDLNVNELAFYWWAAEPIAFSENTEVPSYIYNNSSDVDGVTATVTTSISIKNLDKKEYVSWQLLRKCFNVGLSVNGSVVSAVPLHDKAISFQIPYLGNTKLDEVSYAIQIGKKQPDETFQPYQSIQVDQVAASRYIPVVNTTGDREADCRVSEPNGRVSTECTTKFSTEFMDAVFYPSDLNWLPVISACGASQPVLKDTLPDSNGPLQAYVDGKDLVITMNDVEKWRIDSCNQIEIAWNTDSWKLQKDNGWLPPANITCTLSWSSAEKGKQMSLHCP